MLQRQTTGYFKNLSDFYGTLFSMPTRAISVYGKLSKGRNFTSRACLGVTMTVTAIGLSAVMLVFGTPVVILGLEPS